MRTKAAVVTGKSGKFKISEVDLAELRDDEVLVRVAGGGRADGSPTITQAGVPIFGNFFNQSSFAAYALANEANTVKVAEDLPLALLAPLGCGIQTGAGAVINVLQPAAGNSIAVFGCGSVGLAAVMAAAAVGCTSIVAIEPHEVRRNLAMELGATLALDPGRGGAARHRSGAGLEQHHVRPHGDEHRGRRSRAQELHTEVD
jgi:Zn-dependent alcohol dehydrogenase